MKIANCTLNFLFIAIITLFSIPKLSAQDKSLQPPPGVTQSQLDEAMKMVADMSPEELEQMMRSIKDICEQLLDPVLKGYSELHQVIIRLATEVHAGTIRPKNKGDMSKQLTELSKLVAQFKDNSYTQLDPLQLMVLIKVLHAVIDHLNTALKNGFTELKPFDLDAYITRNPLPALDNNPFEAIQHEIVTFQQQLVALSKSAETAGLTWYNKLYRKIDTYIVDPALSYQVPQRFGKLSATAVIGLLHLWTFLQGEEHQRQDIARRNTNDRINLLDKLTPKKDDDKKGGNNEPSPKSNLEFKALYKKELAELPPSSTISFLQKLNLIERFGFGPAPLHGQTSLQNYEQLGFLGLLEHHFVRSFQHYLGIPEVLSVGVLYYLWKGDINKVCTYITNKAQSWRNHLKGGEYVKRGEKYDGLMPTITFDDIVGLEHQKKVLNDVITYILHPERFDRTQTPPERGYLFVGKPGVGKTELAKAMGGELARQLKALGRSEDEVKFLPVPVTWITQNSVQELLVQAYFNAPCVIFIDEIDFLKLERYSGDSQRLSEFLSLMNGFLDLDPKKQIVIIGATNYSDHLDDALKRYGRFGVHLNFDYPSLNDRKEFLRRSLVKLTFDPADFDLDRIAQETAGCTYEEIRAIVKGVIRKTQTLGVPFTLEAVDQSFDEHVRNIITVDDKIISEAEHHTIATHQAGHALAHILLETRDIVAKVTTRPVTVKLKDEGRWKMHEKKEEHEKQKPTLYGKTFTYCPQDTLQVKSIQERINDGKVLVAGFAAEHVALHSTHSYHIGNEGDVDDKLEAYKAALEIALQGLDIRELSKNKQNELRDQAYALVKQWEQEMIALFQQHEDVLNAVISTLLEKRSLSGTELKEIVNTVGTQQQVQQPEPAIA